MIRLADYLINQLHEFGAKHVFMVTGRGILYLSDAVARHEQLESISVHHEQAASYAAYAYAQATDNLGLCLVSTGCASTNAITGVLCAWQDSVPCVFVSGQNMLQETSYYTQLPIRTYGSQEANIIELVKPITKYATMITDPKDIAFELEKAIHLATTGRKGPVWIDIPVDIQNMRIHDSDLRHYRPECETQEATQMDLAYVKDMLEHAERPVVLVGSGVRTSDATQELQQFLESHSIPLVYTPSAVDVIGAAVDYSIGAIGSLGGSRAGNFTIQNADFVLVIGNRLSPVTIGQPYDKFARDAKVVVVDIDATEHQKGIIEIDKFILSDAKCFLEQLNKLKWHKDNSEWLNKCKHWKNVFPKCEEKYKNSDEVDLHYLGECLSKTMPNDAICLTDAGFEELILPAAISFKMQQRCIHPVSQGAMGFALPAAIGAYYATCREVVSVNGDGSIMMNLQELQTIAFYNIPIKIIVCNNDCYAVIRKRQEDLFRTRIIGTDASNGVACPSFKELADAFHIAYQLIENPKDLEKGLQELMDQDGPVLCEIMCVKKQEYLHSSFARGKDKKIQRRSLEDQSPFMERELLLSEMITTPVDYE